MHSDASIAEYKNWKLPVGEYIVCSFAAENFENLVMDALYKAHGYLFNIWLPNHTLTVAPFSVEHYANHAASTIKTEIWVMPISVE